MTTIKISEPKQKEFIVYGKKRIIRDIRFNDIDNFEAYYKNHFIHVRLTENNRCYATCSAPDGCFIVDGYVGEEWWSDRKRINFGIKECLENILYEEKNV